MSPSVARIGDHAVIGDCRSAALVANDGTLDWLCWPRFDSDAAFSSLLDEGKSGRFELHPLGDFEKTQHYVDDTAVVRTTFKRPGAWVTITDCMTVADDAYHRNHFTPEHELLRVVRCEQGDAEICLSMRLSPSFGRHKVHIADRKALGIHFSARSGDYILRGEAPLTLTDDGRVESRFVLKAGETARFSLSFRSEQPASIPLLGAEADDALWRTLSFWRRWGSRCTYEGIYRTQVVRSAITLKLMTYAPSGAIVAAPTSSLPEKLGGELNWDYRFCWLRDAAFTSRVLLGLGYEDEASAFINWMMRFTSLTHPQLHVMYDVYGEDAPKERELSNLRGYRGSRPVRKGNGARKQLQLDVVGEVVDAVSHWVDRGFQLDHDMKEHLYEFGDYIVENWSRPDHGLWETRGDVEPHTHSRLLCWTAMDRLIGMHDQGVLPKLDVDKAASARRRIHKDIEAHAWSEKLQSYVGVLGTDCIDASVLLLPWYGYERASSDRMKRTVYRVLRDLDAGNGLLYRNGKLRSSGDGGFIVCGFWAAEALADGAGTESHARARFDAMLQHANDVGLLSEEVSKDGELIGNFPQAYSHVGLVSAAFALEERKRRSEGVPAWSQEVWT